jgi:hypothetical protein
VCGDEEGDCEPPPDPPDPPDLDPTGINKCRFISFQIPPQTASETAIRVHLTSLHHPAPCYIECLPLFTLFEGQYVWVGPPQWYVESNATGTTFLASAVQCTPYYQDWSTVGLLHVTGSAIIPSSAYHVEQVASSCEGRESDSDCLPAGANVSSQLQVKTTRWGDIDTPYNPPSTTAQPDVGDISALVNKFRSSSGAPIKARAWLAGVDGFGSISMAQDLDFSHISACVEAFRGMTYPYKIGKCAGVPSPGRSGTCRTNSDCQMGNGDPPCSLYCP